MFDSNKFITPSPVSYNPNAEITKKRSANVVIPRSLTRQNSSMGLAFKTSRNGLLA